jgi:hypothetical protein
MTTFIFPSVEMRQRYSMSSTTSPTPTRMLLTMPDFVAVTFRLVKYCLAEASELRVEERSSCRVSSWDSSSSDVSVITTAPAEILSPG